MMLLANLVNTSLCKKLKMNENLAYGFSSQSFQKELSNECQYDRVGSDGFQKSLPPCAWDESSLSIERVKPIQIMPLLQNRWQ